VKLREVYIGNREPYIYFFWDLGDEGFILSSWIDRIDKASHTYIYDSSGLRDTHEFFSFYACLRSNMLLRG
jgi:hypothetical protein